MLVGGTVCLLTCYKYGDYRVDTIVDSAVMVVTYWVMMLLSF